MKKQIGMPVLATVAVLALVALVVFFVKASGDPAPTAQNVPDYSKMTPAEVSAAYANSKKAEAEAMKDAGGKR